MHLGFDTGRGAEPQEVVEQPEVLGDDQRPRAARFVDAGASGPLGTEAHAVPLAPEVVDVSMNTPLS